MAKLISYDLRAPGRDYSKLKEAILAYPNACKVTKSCWLVTFTGSCSDLRNNLFQNMDANDVLFVVDLKIESSGQNIICGQKGLDAVMHT